MFCRDNAHCILIVRAPTPWQPWQPPALGRRACCQGTSVPPLPPPPPRPPLYFSLPEGCCPLGHSTGQACWEMSDRELGSLGMAMSGLAREGGVILD